MRYLVLSAALLFAFPAYAEESKMAVPQFDPSSYASQIFWLALSFGLLYVLMAKLALPRIGFVIEQRESRLQQDMATARQAAAHAGQLQEDYQAALHEARARARTEMAEAVKAAQAQQTAALSAQNVALTSRVQIAEANIAAARQAAMANITPAAVAVAANTLHKLAGLDAEGAQLASAIDTVLKKAS